MLDRSVLVAAFGLLLCITTSNVSAYRPRLHPLNSAVQELDQRPFPTDFEFGVATASYQIEGAWNLSGKGENIWDRFTHVHPYRIQDGSNGDIACDSYHKFKEDVQLIKNLNVSFYRFSLSWSRILPSGYPNIINQDGIRYYNDLINELIAHNIKPVVTIFHWDLPQPLQEIGGWPNPALAEHYENFARIAFDNFADRVDTWITINEPKQICKMGYGDAWLAPSMPAAGIGDYKCSYTILLAHARAYHLYDTYYRSTHGGKIGITMDSFWFEPATQSAADIAAARRVFDFFTGIYSNPIYGSGDFPETVKTFVRDRSLRQNFTRSRLPEFTAEEVAFIRNTSDFFGLNFYTSIIVQDIPEPDLNVVSWDYDMRVNYTWDHENWDFGQSWWLAVTPWGLRNTLVMLSDLYGNIPIYITENGYSDLETLEDYPRANFYLLYLSACLEAIHDHGVNLQVYTAWSLMDNFEWTHGYVSRFGIHHVDFNDPNRPRTPKVSAGVYGDVVRNRRLPNTTLVVPPKDEDDAGSLEKPFSVLTILLVALLLALLAKY